MIKNIFACVCVCVFGQKGSRSPGWAGGSISVMTSSPDVVVVLREYLSSRINKFGSNVGANSPGVAVDFDVVGAGVRRLLVTGEELQHKTGTDACIFLKSRRVYIHVRITVHTWVLYSTFRNIWIVHLLATMDGISIAG